MGVGSLEAPIAGRQSGFIMLAVLAAMLILALGAQQVTAYVSQQAQRDREADLLRIGQAYVQAIGTYYESSPGSVKRWPRRLEELANDTRFLGVKRHIREIYPDPIARAPWGLLVSPDGGIMGVYSSSERQPIRTAPLNLAGVVIGPANRYADWQFVYQPGVGTAPARY